MNTGGQDDTKNPAGNPNAGNGGMQDSSSMDKDKPMPSETPADDMDEDKDET